MDSNVSKETFLHKFFLLPLSQEKKTISIVDLLRSKLLSIFDLYQQQQNIAFSYQFPQISIPVNIALLDSAIDSRTLNQQADRVFFSSQSKTIVYASSIILVIAACLKKAPQIILEEWEDLWNFPAKNINATSYLKFHISLQQSGWVYFYLSEKSIAIYLKRSLNSFNLKTTITLHLAYSKGFIRGTKDLFSLQYVHARCCSLLRLGVREKIIPNYDALTSLNWLDSGDRLYCQEEAEIYLLRQLFLITDSFTQEAVNWEKLASNFSQTIMVFVAECRFLEAVRQKNPEVALARLGLIALCQYWLQRILTEKLNLPAPTEI